VTGATGLMSGAPTAVGSTLGFNAAGGLTGNQTSAIGSYAVQGISGATLNRRITGDEGWSPRPVLSCNPNLSRGDRTLYAAIDTSCFHPAAVGSTGMDSVIRPIRGPGIENWDMSIFKNVPFGKSEARYLQLRFEFYNIWNHTQWGFLNVTPTFDAAGKITNLAGTPGGGRFGFGALNTVRPAAAGGPRQIQLGVKFYF